jgi:hypothetical protein
LAAVATTSFDSLGAVAVATVATVVALDGARMAAV